MVLDPHADYVLLPLTRDERLHEFSYRITIFRNLANTGRLGKRVGRVVPYEVAFTDLSPDEVCDVAGIREGAVNIREAVRRALESLKGRDYKPQDLLKALEEPDWAVNEKGEPDRGLRGHAESAAKYIRSLTKLRVFGATSTSLEEILRPAHASIIDLSGLDDRAMNYMAARLLSEIYERRVAGSYEYPVFIIIEEAHTFIPPERETYASPIINRIAAEGRKFGDLPHAHHPAAFKGGSR